MLGTKLRWPVNMARSVAGYSLRRKSTPVRTLGEFCTVLKRLDFAPGTVFDVGVAEGTPALENAFPAVPFVLIEPMEEFQGHMNNILKGRSGFMYLSAAGNMRGEVSLNVYPDLRKVSRFKKVGLNVPATKETRKVHMMPLDDILTEHELRPPFLLKIDVEGDELSVLKGAQVVLGLSEVVIVETSVAKRFEGGADFAETVSFLTRHGFRLCDIVAAADTPAGLLLHVDLAFVRMDGDLSKKLSPA